ncbi:MAG: hypothetical protein HY823_03610 [Acidobacteria bacterium]|nr:hypothetical protein [Acidobacteriota bacterium]
MCPDPSPSRPHVRALLAALALLACVEAPARTPLPPAALELLSSEVTHGPGVAPSESTPAFVSTVGATFRWLGRTPPRKDRIRMEILPVRTPEAGPRPRPRAVKVLSLLRPDPADPRLWVAQAAWPGGLGAEHRLKITIRDSLGRVKSAETTIRDAFFQGARPKGGDGQAP